MTSRTKALCCAFAACLGLSQSLLAAQPQCRMRLAFEQADVDAPGGTTPVWSDLEGNLMFIVPLQVNTDGTKRSYSVSDFWGEKHALNNLCNAMKDQCGGLGKEEMRQRRVQTQAAAAAGWPSDQVARVKISNQIIPMPGGTPCKEVDGYLVSSTTLRRPGVADQCDLSQYVDSLATAALVLPKKPKHSESEFSKRGIGIGQLAVAVTATTLHVVAGVVGDLGPSNKLGEASLAMNAKLTGRSGEPENYKEAKQWAAGETFVLIFNGSEDTQEPYMTQDRIDPKALGRFEKWGGTQRALVCMHDYQAASSSPR